MRYHLVILPHKDTATSYWHTVWGTYATVLEVYDAVNIADFLCWKVIDTLRNKEYTSQEFRKMIMGMCHNKE